MTEPQNPGPPASREWLRRGFLALEAILTLPGVFAAGMSAYADAAAVFTPQGSTTAQWILGPSLVLMIAAATAAVPLAIVLFAVAVAMRLIAGRQAVVYGLLLALLLVPSFYALTFQLWMM